MTAAALATGMLAAVDPAPAEAATVDTSAWDIPVNRNSGKVVEARDASTTDGGDVVHHTDWGGPGQQWQMIRRALSGQLGPPRSAPSTSAALRSWNSTPSSPSGSGLPPTSSPRSSGPATRSCTTSRWPPTSMPTAAKLRPAPSVTATARPSRTTSTSWPIWKTRSAPRPPDGYQGPFCKADREAEMRAAHAHFQARLDAEIAAGRWTPPAREKANA
ncbi:RICIN domain-containing protein [Streptomyces sp. NPDC016640]|uniref:RICIN domain-containing protein n=1 Tax=Streptomyces sp. NPDC016640 TaxID=3364969 RepID=UPI0036F92D15